MNVIGIDLFDKKLHFIMIFIGNLSYKFAHTSHLAPYMACKYGHMIHLNHI